MEVDQLLQTGLMEVVDAQISSGSPPETGETYRRLLEAGYSEQETKRMIARALVVEMHTVVSEGSPFNRARFARMLGQLPQLPADHWD